MIYNLTGGDFKQIAFIEKNWTVIDLYKWISLKNYIIEKAQKDK